MWSSILSRDEVLAGVPMAEPRRGRRAPQRTRIQPKTIERRFSWCAHGLHSWAQNASKSFGQTTGAVSKNPTAQDLASFGDGDGCDWNASVEIGFDGLRLRAACHFECSFFRFDFQKAARTDTMYRELPASVRALSSLQSTTSTLSVMRFQIPSIFNPWWQWFS